MFIDSCLIKGRVNGRVVIALVQQSYRDKD